MASDVKWIKIVTDIFNDEKMYAIETLPDGFTLELVWFKILCLAGKCNQNGFLFVSQKIAYTDEMLAKIFRMEIGIVQRALKLFQDLEMIEVVDNAHMVSNWLMYQNGDRLEEIQENNRNRQQRYRDRQKLLADNERNVTNNVTNNATNNVSSSYSNSISNSLSSFSSNNSNSNNYIYILENYKEKDYLVNNTELNNCIKEWFEYKDNKKPKVSNHYDTERGMKILLGEFVKYDKQFGTKAVVETVTYTISNNYQGIVWDRLEKQAKNARGNGMNIYEQILNS